MSQDSNSRIVELSSLCKRQRQGKKHPRYDDEVKALARELVASGVEKGALARAAGVSSSAVRAWVGSAEPKHPRRRSVKILDVENGGDGTAEPGRDNAIGQGRMVMMIRVSEFDVAIYSRDGGRP